jgi:hypothetical protein
MGLERGLGCQVSDVRERDRRPDARSRNSPVGASATAERAPFFEVGGQRPEARSKKSGCQFPVVSSQRGEAGGREKKMRAIFKDLYRKEP